MTGLHRRRFLKISGVSCAAIASGAFLEPARPSGAVEARYYEKQNNKKIKCVLCPRECVIDNLERGYCGVRENNDGTYYTLIYGRPCTIHIDPIEKKPLFHFYPGSEAYSTATVGCNINCKFCQNWEISQSRPEQMRNYDLSPADFVSSCRRQNIGIIAYTYSEPVIFTEYMFDICTESRKYGIKNVMISNGFIQEKPMNDLIHVMDAVKIDLKSFRDDYYRRTCEGELKPVLNTLMLLSKSDVWFEIVYLVVPTLNDSESELADLSSWCVNTLGPDVPMHFSRFYPQYRLKNLPPTPISTLETARRIYSEAGGNFVYIGNVPGHTAENTNCPACGNVLIKRRLYDINIEGMTDGKCAECQKTIPGVW